MKIPMVSFATSFQRVQTSLQSPMPRLLRSNVDSTRDLAKPSASVHRKRFFTPSLTLKFLCAGYLNSRKLLLLMVPCDRLTLYEPNSSADTNASLLFGTAEWSALFDGEREILKASNNTISSIKSCLQDSLQALNAARASGQRYPATGPELRNVTIVNERRDRIFLTSINRFQRPFDRGPVDRYGASGFVVTAPYVFKFSVFSYVRNENDLLAIAETAVDALSLGGQH